MAATEKGVRTRVAKEIGVAKSVIGDWEKGSIPNAERFFRLADVLAVDPRWLVDGTVPAASTFDDDGWVKLPRFDLIDFIDGHPVPIEEVPIRREWLLTSVRTIAGLWLAEMPSDAMPDTAREGETIICRAPEQLLQDGKVYVLVLDGRLIVRRVQVRPEGLVLKAGDASIDPIVVHPDRVEQLTPVGRVLGKISVEAI